MQAKTLSPEFKGVFNIFESTPRKGTKLFKKEEIKYINNLVRGEKI